MHWLTAEAKNYTAERKRDSNKVLHLQTTELRWNSLVCVRYFSLGLQQKQRVQWSIINFEKKNALNHIHYCTVRILFCLARISLSRKKIQLSFIYSDALDVEGSVKRHTDNIKKLFCTLTHGTNIDWKYSDIFFSRNFSYALRTVSSVLVQAHGHRILNLTHDLKYII